MLYTYKEVELTLNLYSIAKLHLLELERSNTANTKENSDHFMKSNDYYDYVVKLVQSWISKLLPDEVEIIKLRIFEKKSFDYIAIRLGYANHSSALRRYRDILEKMSLQGESNV